ncbi:uncharacterized protein N7482_008313 [Penicillium canariense]|uniref:Globin-sensor domain-containing protein n=1 Tax=Penicillium canariense TaxID=189055 RepID=A0A9W9LIG2_9EURO|nr:uncharacterized protein N7482_008313 [Penicillium canariense]KAJ5157213.1 hypothetical protein N7482_008313 [Penicillium canariense]
MPVDYGLGPGPEPKHIDRKGLYVSLDDRIKYLHEFLDFNSGKNRPVLGNSDDSSCAEANACCKPADVEALQSGSKYLKQLIPAVVNLVYKKLLQYDITSRAFHTGSTAIETEPEQDYLHEETPQIRRRKMFLRWYLIKLCQDPTSMDFWRYLSKVGMMHSGQGRLHPLNIEFIHINACMGYIQDIFIEALLSHPQISLRRKIALLRAVNKILCIQLDLFAKWRLRDGEEYEDEMSVYSFGSGKEGCLGDKTILGSSSSSSADDDTASIASVTPSTHSAQTTQTAQFGASRASVCPFADLAQSSSSETKIWAN